MKGKKKEKRKESRRKRRSEEEVEKEKVCKERRKWVRFPMYVHMGAGVDVW